jgi:hypothetical protein
MITGERGIKVAQNFNLYMIKGKSSIKNVSLKL